MCAGRIAERADLCRIDAEPRRIHLYPAHRELRVDELRRPPRLETIGEPVIHGNSDNSACRRQPAKAAVTAPIAVRPTATMDQKHRSMRASTTARRQAKIELLLRIGAIGDVALQSLRRRRSIAG